MEINSKRWQPAISKLNTSVIAFKPEILEKLCLQYVRSLKYQLNVNRDLERVNHGFV